MARGTKGCFGRTGGAMVRPEEGRTWILWDGVDGRADFDLLFRAFLPDGLLGAFDAMGVSGTGR
ncbi:MAG: hypothetical protein FJ265_14650 [Planctomycetes bacterium]|nr:hypothetical protein [Planctomycetota bacterium]